jgi:hypothetical protein
MSPTFGHVTPDTDTPIENPYEERFLTVFLLVGPPPLRAGPRGAHPDYDMTRLYSYTRARDVAMKRVGLLENANSRLYRAYEAWVFRRMFTSGAFQ